MLKNLQIKSLVSDVPYQAKYIDKTVQNPSAIIKTSDNMMAVINYLSNICDFYTLDGIKKNSFTIPTNYPTSIVENKSNGFSILYNNKLYPSEIIIVTVLGYIYGYNKNADPNNAIQIYFNQNKSFEDIFITSDNNYIYVVDSANANIEKYSSYEYPLTNPIASFTDAIMTAINYVPYGMSYINNMIYITYVNNYNVGLNNIGIGYINAYDMDGNFIKRFANSDSYLNSPSTIIKYENIFLVPNAGDGKILKYSENGTFLGYLKYNNTGDVILIAGINDIVQINNNIYFVAGINFGSNGLIGYIYNASNNNICNSIYN